MEKNRETEESGLSREKEEKRRPASKNTKAPLFAKKAESNIPQDDLIYYF